MNLGHVFAQGDIVLITVFLLLVLMSVLTWWIIIMRSFRLHQVRHANRGTIESVATVASLDDMLRLAKAHPSPLADLTESAIQAAHQYRANPASQLTSIPLGDYLVQHIKWTLPNAASTAA